MADDEDEDNNEVKSWIEKQRDAMHRLSRAAAIIHSWCLNARRQITDRWHCHSEVTALDNMGLDDKLRLYHSLDYLSRVAHNASCELFEHFPKVGESPLSRNLKAIREQKLTFGFDSFAKAGFVSFTKETEMIRRDLWFWEFGYADPTADELERLAKCLDVTVDDLLKEPEEEDEEWPRDDEPVEVPIKRKPGRPKKQKN